MLGTKVVLLVSALVTGLASTQAQDLTITEPTASHWWIAGKDNTLSWTGGANPPTTFSVFLNNPDPKVLTSKLALISVEQYYEMSKTVNPGTVTPSTGYTIELTDTLNSSHIYATSDTFEIKPSTADYPPQSDAASVSSGSSSPSGSASSSGSAPSASKSGSGFKGYTASLGLIGGGLAIHLLL